MLLRLRRSHRRGGLLPRGCLRWRRAHADAGLSQRVGKLMRQTSRMRLAMRREMRVDIGKSWWWSFKTFKLLPCLARLEDIDVPARFIFPLCYGAYLLVMFNEVQGSISDLRRLGGAQP